MDFLLPLAMLTSHLSEVEVLDLVPPNQDSRTLIPATSSALNLPLVLGEFKRPRLDRPEPPDLGRSPLMSLGNIRKMNKEQTRRSNRIVTHTSARDDGEPYLLDGIEDLGSEDHVVITRDEAFDPALGEVGD